MWMLLALAWRWPLWTRFRFREDEALYGHWAWLVYSGIDVMLARAPVDKPPLFPYLVARLFAWLTPSEAVVRLPSLVASTLALPLVYAWARDLLGRATAWRALAVYAALPLAVLMAPTAYLDPLMVGFCLLAAWAAERTRPLAWAWAAISGLALGAAVATKPFALLWLPLLWGLAWTRRRVRPAWALAWGLGFLYPLWQWWTWERLRAAPSTLALALQHYGGVTLLPPAVWPQRLAAWADVAAAAWGGGLLLLAALGLGYVAVRRGTRPVRLLAGWMVLVGCGYAITSLASWDRYLLLLAPVAAVVVAHGWQHLAQSPRFRRAQCLLLAALLVTGMRAAQAAYPVGGDHGAYDGIDAVSAYIMATLPRGGIVYHHWLGWHYGFYLFAAPYDYRWWRDPEWLAEDAAQPDGIPRVVVFPAWAEATHLAALDALQARGVQPCLLVRVYGPDGQLRFYVYQLTLHASCANTSPFNSSSP